MNSDPDILAANCPSRRGHASILQAAGSTKGDHFADTPRRIKGPENEHLPDESTPVTGFRAYDAVDHC